MQKGTTEETGAWHEYSPAITLDASEEFLDYIASLTLPDSCSYQGRVDTSGILQHVLLRVRRATQINSYDIYMQVTGFYGPGSETIKALCRRMFALAGYNGYQHVTYDSEG
jgi:hypothetical protein